MNEREFQNISYVRVRNREIRPKDEFVKEYRKSEWRLVRWKKRPALFDRYTERIELYIGQEYDKKRKTLIKNLWDHDHCEQCSAIISEYRSDDFSEAWTIDETIWLCPRCYAEVFAEAQEPELADRPKPIHHDLKRRS